MIMTLISYVRLKKKKKIDNKQFDLFDEADKKLTLDEETKKDEESKLTELPKWLHSKNDFKRTIKLIEDIRADTNNVKSSSGDKKDFNNLNELINNIKNKKTTRKSAIKKIRDIVSNLDQQRQKESTVFQNKTIREHKEDVDQDKNGEDLPKLESVEVVLVHCNLVNNNYQQTSKVLFTFAPNKQFRLVINIAPPSLRMLGGTNTGFSFIEVWFTVQNSEPLEIEDNVNLTLTIGLTL